MVAHMGFKYSLYAATVLAALSGCYAPPSTDDAFDDAVIITSHNEEADFGQFGTFYVQPQIRLLDEEIGLNENPEFVADAIATPLLDATRDNLTARGFTEAASQDEADLAVGLLYLRNVNTQQYCYAYWGWYGYYYYPGYYYPYCDTSVWRSGTLLTNVVDMTGAEPAPPVVDPPALPDGTLLNTVWASGVYGAEVDSLQYVEQRAISGINQAFVQSPYFVAAP